MSNYIEIDGPEALCIGRNEACGRSQVDMDKRALFERRKSYKAYMRGDGGLGDAYYTIAQKKGKSPKAEEGLPGTRKNKDLTAINSRLDSIEVGLSKIEDRHQKKVDRSNRLKGHATTGLGLALGAGAAYAGKKLYDKYKKKNELSKESSIGRAKVAGLGSFLGVGVDRISQDGELRDLVADYGVEKAKESLYSKKARRAYNNGDMSAFREFYDRAHGGQPVIDMSPPTRDDNVLITPSHGISGRRLAIGAGAGAGAMLLGIGAKRLYDQRMSKEALSLNSVKMGINKAKNNISAGVENRRAFNAGVKGNFDKMDGHTEMAKSYTNAANPTSTPTSGPAATPTSRPTMSPEKRQMLVEKRQKLIDARNGETKTTTTPTTKPKVDPNSLTGKFNTHLGNAKTKFGDMNKAHNITGKAKVGAGLLAVGYGAKKLYDHAKSNKENLEGQQ